MRVSATLKGVPDSLGRRTVYIRVADKSFRSFSATSIRVLPHQFKKGKVKDHPKAKQLNDEIKDLILKKEAELRTGRSYEDALFSFYVSDCINQWKRTKSFATIVQYTDEKEKFIQHQGDMMMSRITLRVLNDYKGKLFDLGYAPNTVWKSFRFLRTILLKALKESVIKENPMLNMEFPRYRNPPRHFLTPEQLNKLEEYSKDPTVKGVLRTKATWFLIGCYTGLRFSDLVKFDCEGALKNGRINLYTTKTKEPLGLKLEPKVKDLLLRVKDKPLVRSNDKYNKDLKVIQRDLKLKDILHAHISRHTFGVLCAEKGLSIEVTSKLMAITPKSAEVYYKLTGKRIEDEYSRLFA